MTKMVGLFYLVWVVNGPRFPRLNRVFAAGQAIRQLGPSLGCFGETK